MIDAQVADAPRTVPLAVPYKHLEIAIIQNVEPAQSARPSEGRLKYKQRRGANASPESTIFREKVIGAGKFTDNDLLVLRAGCL
jgi:hypothetical protein